jgi:glycosyltransferase involved in cell wall biosynthesis
MKSLALVGGSSASTAYARVNRYWLQELGRMGYAIDAEAPVAIHHDYSVDFPSQVLAAPRRAAVRTWDFGPYPRIWVEAVQRNWEQLWVHSQWTAAKAVEGGVPAEKIHVIPHGFDPDIYRPDGPCRQLPGQFRVLFVGATVHRKGFDILVKACRALAEDEEICLVVKDHSGDVFYQGLQLRNELQSLPVRVVYLDEYLSDADLAALYRSCQVAVFPYRAEGFALPILEAMACGLACIVPAFGACLDYCNADNSFPVPIRRIKFPVHHDFQFNTLGFTTAVEEVDFCEVRLAGLVETLQLVRDLAPDLLAAKGARAAREMSAGWTWRHSAQRLVQALFSA